MTATLQRGSTSTGASLGEPIDVLTHGAGGVGHTHVHYGFVDNPVLRDVLPLWDSTLSSINAVNVVVDRAIAVISEHAALYRISIDELAGRVITWLAPSPATPDMLPAVDAVGYVSDALGLPVQSVLTAAAIAPRTYYSWREALVRQPRLGSQGGLWKLVQATEDLRALLGDDLRKWVVADPARRNLFEAGEVDQLLASALVESQRQSGPWQQLGPSSAAGVEMAAPPTRGRGRPVRTRPAQRVNLSAARPSVGD